MRGPFIAIEGPDGAGTTKHTGLLTERLRAEGRDVLTTYEPTSGSIGSVIRSILRSDLPSPAALQLLFTADRAEHVQTVILPALENGTTVITDRFTLSTLVYGAAQGLDAEWLRQVNAKFPEPDLMILLLPPFSVCLERIARREQKDHFEQEGFLRKVYDEYAKISGPRIVTIDTSSEPEVVAEDIFRAVKTAVSPFSGKQWRIA